MSAAIDWEELRAEAQDAAQRAYAPYSRVHVGAAALVMPTPLALATFVAGAGRHAAFPALSHDLAAQKSV